jgi:hypothetical protein
LNPVAPNTCPTLVVTPPSATKSMQGDGNCWRGIQAGVPVEIKPRAAAMISL